MMPSKANICILRRTSYLDVCDFVKNLGKNDMKKMKKKDQKKYRRKEDTFKMKKKTRKNTS